MKTLLYISAIIASYRAAIDHVCDGTPLDREAIERELNVVSHRDFSTGFFYKSPMENANINEGTQYNREMRLAALVTGTNGERASLKIYNTISSDTVLEYVAPNLKITPIGRTELFNKDGSPIDKARHIDEVTAIFYDRDGQIILIHQFDILRMEASF